MPTTLNRVEVSNLKAENSYRHKAIATENIWKKNPAS